MEWEYKLRVKNEENKPEFLRMNDTLVSKGLSNGGEAAETWMYWYNESRDITRWVIERLNGACNNVIATIEHSVKSGDEAAKSIEKLKSKATRALTRPIDRIEVVSGDI